MHKVLICMEKRDFHRLVDVSRQYAGNDLNKCYIFNKKGYTSEIYKEKKINGKDCVLFGWSTYSFDTKGLQNGYDIAGIFYEIERTKNGYILMEFEDEMMVNFKDESKMPELKAAINIDEVITRDDFALIYNDKNENNYKKTFLINMTEKDMLKYYENKIVEEGIRECSNFDTIINLNEYGDGIDLAKYKNQILQLLYKDERVADVTIDGDMYVDIVFYTDYCPYYYDNDEETDENCFLNKENQEQYLKEFANYYAERCIFEQPYITTRNLINNYVNEIDNINRIQRYKIANILKKNIIESGFVEKYVEDTEIYVTPKNYKELEDCLLKKCKEITNNEEQEEQEEI